MAPQHKIEKTRRQYNQWVATESLEDYALRYSPESFRKWSSFVIGNTAIGSISFLALEAIGAALLLDYGFSNAFWGIVFASLIIFMTGIPIAYYCARYNVDIDLLTRSAGFGYVGSTVTSLIYASFCFIFFALEAAIMAQALLLYFGLPLFLGYIVCSLIIIPIVFYGITLINRLQLWTQPLWIILMLIPLYFVLISEPDVLNKVGNFSGTMTGSNQFDSYYFGIAFGISLSLIAQIGEQVDYLRFMPEKHKNNRLSWWFVVIMAGPGWILLGFFKQMIGILLAALAVLSGLALAEAKQPVQMYDIAYRFVFDNPETALLLSMIFVVVSQIKINVTNAYAGSLAWSNFFSRVTHSHPGRVIWLIFNIAVALILMEMGVFEALTKVLGLYSNIAIAWIAAITADLVINKPLKLSPAMVEFKRAHLFSFNPVGFVSMTLASVISMAAFTGLFGLYAQAYASLLALSISFVLTPVIAKLTRGKFYIARTNEEYSCSEKLEICGVCEKRYAQTDMAYCPYYDQPICSLCCTLDSNCHDGCKPEQPEFYQQGVCWIVNLLSANKISQNSCRRIANFLLTWGFMLTIVGSIIWIVFVEQTELSDTEFIAYLRTGFYQIFLISALVLSVFAWWIVLMHESRHLAEIELDEQNIRLTEEIAVRKQAQQRAMQSALELRKQTDVIERNYQQLARSETLFRQLIQAQPAVFFRVDAKFLNFTFVSKQAETILGYPVEQWLDEPHFWENHLHEEDRSWAPKFCFTQTKAFHNHEMEYRMISAKGEIIWIRDIVNLIIEDGEVKELIGFLMDITQSKVDSDKIQRLSELYATLSQINQAIIKKTDETELFDELCRIAVRLGSLSMAWVGVKRDRDQRIIPVARAGEHVEYLNEIKISANPALAEGRGPSGTAYREQKVVVIKRFMGDVRTKPWQHVAKTFNWASSCCIPIIRGNESYAVFNVYSQIEGYFTDEIVQLLTELGEDLNFALESFDRETARKKAEDELYLSAQVFAQSQEAILITDKNNHILSVNQAFTRITGYTDEEVKGKNINMYSSDRQNFDFYRTMWKEINTLNYWQGEIWNRRKNGEIFPVWMSISCVKDTQDKINNYIVIFSDISQHKEAEAHIEHLAHYDPLTDLPNRVLLKAHVDHELITAERNRSHFALLFLDLDHFKNINDSLGHPAGDKLLVEIARRLKTVVREEDTVSRLGGDEFNILLPDTNFKGAALVVEKIITAINEPAVIDNNQLHISTSVGISLFPENGKDYETLHKNADTALYQAKANGRNQYQFFTLEMQQKTLQRLKIETHLRKALVSNELVLYYQPQVDAVSHKIIGAEALIRWRHPQWGLVSPAEFIPVAEDTGLIIPMGDWVLQEAVQQIKIWHQAGYDDLTVAVNLSMAQFCEQTLVKKVVDVLTRVQLESRFLELELTESMAMKNAEEAITITQDLAKTGIQLSIDDFGTGYSSLAYLQRFALDKLKIDQSFTAKIVENQGTENIVNAIISLAKSLDLKTIAEGVETKEQFEMLIAKDCDQIQGYYFSRPLPASEFTTLLEKGFDK